MPENPFEQAYVEYVRAIKAAWADVDVDAVVENMLDDDGNVMQGCGEGLSSYGTAGSFGTLACAGGTAGTFGTIGTAGTWAPTVKRADASTDGSEGSRADSYEE